MKDGGVWVLASTPLNGETREKLDQLGPVRWVNERFSVSALSHAGVLDISLEQTPSTECS
jgi:hypothetical protein